MIAIEIKAVPEWERDKLNGTKCTFERKFRKEETFRKAMKKLTTEKLIRYGGKTFTPIMESIKITR